MLLASAVGGCAPRPPARHRTPAPLRTPAPRPPQRLGEPRAAPAPDRTREPFSARIGRTTPARTRAAFRLADRARRELESGTTAAALDLIDRAIDLLPNTAAFYVVRAQAHVAEGSAAAARSDLERAAALHPSPPWLAEAVATNGAIEESAGHLGAAQAAYRRALQIDPANRSARRALRRLAGP